MLRLRLKIGGGVLLSKYNLFASTKFFTFSWILSHFKIKFNNQPNIDHVQPSPYSLWIFIFFGGGGGGIFPVKTNYPSSVLLNSLN